MPAIAIHSRHTVTPEGLIDATVIIKNGLIDDIIPGLPKKGEYELIDYGSLTLMPGIIDPHVHINEPGRTDWEGFNTATRAAIAGGITSLMDMPLNSSPVTTTVEALDKKIKATKDQLHCHCGFWGGIIPGNEDEIEKLIEKGVPGFKAFLVHSGTDDFPNVTENDLRKAMPVVARYSLPILVHCETPVRRPDSYRDSEGGSNGKRLPDGVKSGEFLNERSYRAYMDSRPREWEDKAIELMIRLCEEFQCPVHIVHLSSSGSIGQIAEAKEKGLPLTVETAQHYLYFSAEDIGDGQTQFKCAPPIREKENNKKLWQALKEGIIDFVATDHSPALPAMKELSSGNFFNAWGGISSLQFGLPVLWTVTKKRGGGLEDIVKWLSEKPAILPGKEKTKGKIAKGYDADLVVWDPAKSFSVTKEIIQHKHKLTPYMGEELFGVVESTWLGGEKVFDKGKYLHLNRGNILTR